MWGMRKRRRGGGGEAEKSGGEVEAREVNVERLSPQLVYLCVHQRQDAQIYELGLLS